MRNAGQRGFTIVSAIFILVVLAALGAAMVTISTTQQIGSALDVQGARAYQAARAGLEWGLYQLQASAYYHYQFGFGASPVGSNPNTTADPNLRGCPTSPSSFTLPAGAASLSEFTVTVTCNAYTDGATGGPTVYVIESTACNQPLAGWTATTVACPGNSGTFGYIERRVRVTL